jgi:hypothetical protein
LCAALTKKRLLVLLVCRPIHHTIAATRYSVRQALTGADMSTASLAVTAALFAITGWMMLRIMRRNK